MRDSQEPPFPYIFHATGRIYDAGGDDLDCAPNAHMTSVLCTVSILRQMLPQARPIVE